MDTVTAFESYIKHEYRTYQSEIVERLMTHINSLPTAQQPAFKDFIEEHHKNAFDVEGMWEIGVESRCIASEIPGEAYEVLDQLVSGPKTDDEVASTYGTSWLKVKGLIIRICDGGEPLTNATNYLGWRVHKLVKENNGNYKLPTPQ